MSARLAFAGVACRRGRMIFADVGFALEAGEALLVSGPNGIGKSSLLRIAAGLLPPAAGTIVREGRVALADERAALDAQSPLAVALGFWTRLDGAPGDAVAHALKATGTAHLAEVPVRLLSTGQRRRAGIARAIASGAAIWLLDEPASGLDAEGAALLGAAMARHRGGGGIVLAATHQPLALPGAGELRLGR